MRRLVVWIVPLLLLWFPVVVWAKPPGAWRDVEKHGLGVGYIEAHYGDGLKLFYDYTPLWYLQFHLNVYEATVFSFPETHLDTLETHSTGGAVAVRLLPVPAWGWFAGWGWGRSHVVQEVPPALAHRGETQPVVSTGSYAYSFYEVGWQGWEGFYLTVNLQKGKSRTIREDDRTGSIMDPDVREKAHYGFGAASTIMALHLGFGWHL